MGVLSCSRSGCPCILCDTHILTVGYICSECQREFKEYLNTNQISPKTDTEIVRELKGFMATDKGHYNKGDKISVDEFFSNNTR